jgi:hypothetical protein
MKPILIFFAALFGLFVFVGLLVDEVGAKAAVSALGAALCLVVGTVAFLFVEWGGRGKTDR